MSHHRQAAPAPGAQWFAAHLQAIEADGQLTVLAPGQGLMTVAWLENAGQLAVALAPGDTLLVCAPGAGQPAVATGRIGRYVGRPAELNLKADSAVSLQCGAASLELRADGQVLLKGEDVVLRAKGTQRIRAGTVSIN